jgi:protein required for attachment to host cells
VTNASIWVLIAGDSDAAIWTSESGVSRLLCVIRQDGVEGGRAGFAWQLMSELLRGAKADETGGIIVIATEEMLEELRKVTVPQVKRLLVAEIPGAPATIAAIPTKPVQTMAWGTVQ